MIPSIDNGSLPSPAGRTVKLAPDACAFSRAIVSLLSEVLEAMTFKVPVILNSQIRGIKYLAKDKFSCLYFENNKNDLCKKLLFLAKNFKARKKLAENAFKSVQKFNKKDVAKIWLKNLKIL